MSMTEDPEFFELLANACADLGLDINTFPRNLRPAAGDERLPVAQSDMELAITDVEWEVLSTLVPTEPLQAEAYGNRQILDAVLWVW